MARFLRENRPWSRLVERGNIAIREIEPGKEFALTPSLRATALKVPHRDEDSDTVAYLVAGPSRTAPVAAGHRPVGEVGPAARGLRGEADRDDAFSTEPSSPPTRSPAARSRRSRIRSCPKRRGAYRGREGPPRRVFFVHLNHTNRLLWDEAAVRRSKRKGFGVAPEGQRFPL